jgi:hypothetical protein
LKSSLPPLEYQKAIAEEVEWWLSEHPEHNKESPKEEENEHESLTNMATGEKYVPEGELDLKKKED